GRTRFRFQLTVQLIADFPTPIKHPIRPWSSGERIEIAGIDRLHGPRRRDPLGSDTARVDWDHLGSARWVRNEMREARHSSTDVLDLSVRWKPWPHEPGQAQPDKLGPQTHFAHPTRVDAQQLTWRV